MLFKDKYPELTSMIKEVAGDNNISCKQNVTAFEIESFIDDTGYDLNQLTEQAKKVTDDEFFMFCSGDELDVNKLILEKKIGELNKFLNDVFDDFLHDLFYT